MVIIAGHLRVDADKRDAFVAAHADLVRRARRYPGCLELSISADPLDPERVNMFEHWESEADLAAWREAANPPKLDVAITGGQVQKHRVSWSGSPF